jgi:hypothetical protein
MGSACTLIPRETRLVNQTVNAVSNQYQQGSACGYGDKEEKDAKHG